MSMNAVANETSIRLWSDISSAGNIWTIVPHVTAPAGRVFRYEIAAKKSGVSGSSQTHQAGKVGWSATGTGTLSTLKISIGTNEHCAVEIKVFDGNETIATQTLALPH